MWKTQRRKKLLSAPFPSVWRRFLETRLPLYNRLPASDRTELEGHIQVFLSEKNFEGCGGLVMKDGIRLCIAAQACLLLLHRNTDYYPGLRSVLVYPSGYFAKTTEHLGSGIMEEREDARLGESWSQGAVVLAWDAVCRSMMNDESGHNLVIHEFAHQLDFENGRTDGAPAFDGSDSRVARSTAHASWARVLNMEYEQLRAKVQRGEKTILHEYGAANPAEFFAVATECFFNLPQQMQEKHPELYEEFKSFFQQDPAQWQRRSD